MSKKDIFSEQITVDGELYDYHVSPDCIVIREATGKAGEKRGWKHFKKFPKKDAAAAQDAWKKLYERRYVTASKLVVQVEDHEKNRRNFLASERENSSVAVVEPQNETAVSFLLNLKSLAAHMDYRYTIIKNPSRAASRAVVEIGFLVLLAKRELPNGELTKWMAENTRVSEQWARLCRRAAEKFCETHGEQALLTLCNPSEDNPPEAVQHAEQLMMEFTGGVGPTALLHNLGIKKRDSGGGSDAPPSDEPRELILARAGWREIVNAVASHQQDWLLLTDHEIEMINDTLWPVAKQINQSVKSKK